MKFIYPLLIRILSQCSATDMNQPPLKLSGVFLLLYELKDVFDLVILFHII